MVKGGFFSEGAGLPAFHTRCQNSDQINPAAFNGRITADGFETFPPEELASARDMLDADKPEIITYVPFLERSPHQTQSRVLRELAQQKLKVTFIKGHVPVQAANKTVFQTLYSLIARIERVNLPSKMPLLPFRRPQQLDPGILQGVLLYDFIRAVSRAIAHDDPTQWFDRLRDYRFQSQLNKSRFIPGRCDQHIGVRLRHFASRD